MQNFDLVTGSMTGKYHKGIRIRSSIRKKRDSYIGSLAGRTVWGALINNVSSNVSINIIIKSCSYCRRVGWS